MASTTESVPGINFENLIPWFSEHVQPVDSLTAKVIGHGRSNITYRLESPEGSAWVLRRPPLSHVLPTAHDMKREYRVISALEGTGIPVPDAIALCEDSAVIGAQFYIMSFVDGMVPADPAAFAAKYPESARRGIGENLIDTLADLHAVDAEKVGLGDFGKPAGFVARQVKRFASQIEQHKTDRPFPELPELARRLQNALPEETGAFSIVHGDYRIDNCVLGEDGRIAAILDWEMSSLGDPLTDVGLIYMYWNDAQAGSQTGVASNSVTAQPGFLSRREAMERYAKRSGRDLANLDFYILLAHFKLAVIVEGIYARFLEGGTVGTGFETTGAQAVNLARSGLALADRSSVAALRG
jgi:aminoglycoside phosphotransferase (APT) family kinase protein